VLSDVGGQSRVRNIHARYRRGLHSLGVRRSEGELRRADAEQGRQLWKLPLAGRERVALSPNAILPDSDSQIRLETSAAQPVALAVFPPVASAVFNGGQVASVRDGVFQRFTASAIGAITGCCRVYRHQAG